jgi:hypothetical protein
VQGLALRLLLWSMTTTPGESRTVLCVSYGQSGTSLHRRQLARAHIVSISVFTASSWLSGRFLNARQSMQAEHGLITAGGVQAEGCEASCA